VWLPALRICAACYPRKQKDSLRELQGSCQDSIDSKIDRPGDRVRMAKGSVHNFDVRPGPDFLYLAVVFNGIRVGDQELRADDPRL